MPTRACLDCGVLVQVRAGMSKEGTRCPKCSRDKQRAKRLRRPRATRAEDRRRVVVVAQWRATYGDWCPGWQRSPHPSADLTADHVLPVGAGGAESGPLMVLCRSCNGAKQANVSALK